ncbi:MAG TPA: sugar transferase [Methylococcaceae bacterium]|nr:sugar transferase [Methylococcaceae bacterium]HIA45086.1 sugar transferase [Methylococcaceae bacterium]HIB63156.1 sugar transferase [Methylococcaceae bacterium]HIN69559.1 sugar transferase [Methylococcales bacterium]
MNKVPQQNVLSPNLIVKSNIIVGLLSYLARWLYLLRVSAKMLSIRSFDLFVAAMALLILAPLLLIVVCCIFIDSPGAIFYSQKRVGINGRIFNFWKFRSMVVNAEQQKDALISDRGVADSVRFKMKQDPRITRVGRFIRKYSIDELPQLWNVLKGDMSLVGPRPPVPKEVNVYSSSDRRRMRIIPGITCIWQVSGRSEIPFEEQVRLDEDYILSVSFWTNVKLLLRTIPAVLFGKGAY